ncbi:MULTISPECIES: hypothetical protein [unclassified Pseudoclavibacter]|uniref:hypothetical protein n=1 Tax=unclassified Pseudoclavibacter TaxID=2615177 RepID=UPI001BA9C54E|nr:hypothetical protein [Pseudoclavibacter sp. Marseille-Q4354]MBS3177752.1 hypothetical protein [Pseudoclavibacter sp. Marseille-Q4354]
MELLSEIQDVTVVPDVEDKLQLPAIVYTPSGEGQTGNGPGLWLVRLDVQALGAASAAWNTVSDVYAAAHRWPGRTTKHGHIASVEDLMLPERQPTTVLGQKSVGQYSAAFRLVIDTNRKAP